MKNILFLLFLTTAILTQGTAQSTSDTTVQEKREFLDLKPLEIKYVPLNLHLKKVTAYNSFNTNNICRNIIGTQHFPIIRNRNSPFQDNINANYQSLIGFNPNDRYNYSSCSHSLDLILGLVSSLLEGK